MGTESPKHDQSEDTRLFGGNSVLSSGDLIKLQGNREGAERSRNSDERKKETRNKKQETASMHRAALLRHLNTAIADEEAHLKDLKKELKELEEQQEENTAEINDQKAVVSKLEEQVTEQRDCLGRYDTLTEQADALNEAASTIRDNIEQEMAQITLQTHAINEETWSEAAKDLIREQNALEDLKRDIMRDSEGNAVLQDESGYFKRGDDGEEKIYYDEKDQAAFEQKALEGGIASNSPELLEQREKTQELRTRLTDLRESAKAAREQLIEESGIRERVELMTQSLDEIQRVIGNLEEEMDNIEDEVEQKYGMSIEELREDTKFKESLLAEEREKLQELIEKNDTLANKIQTTKNEMLQTEERLADMKLLRDNIQDPDNSATIESYYAGELEGAVVAQTLGVPSWLMTAMRGLKESGTEENTPEPGQSQDPEANSGPVPENTTRTEPVIQSPGL